MKLAQTFTCRYNPKEDRLRLVLNYDHPVKRTDFWLTRSFVLKLLPQIETFYYQHASKSPQHAKRSRPESPHHAKRGKPESPAAHRKTDIASYKLMMREALLLETVNLSYNQGQHRTQIRFVSGDEAVAASLDGEQLRSFVKIIADAIPASQWGIMKGSLTF
jgi:hypothetical protein